jgi:serine/threonine-protein kinase
VERRGAARVGVDAHAATVRSAPADLALAAAEPLEGIDPRTLIELMLGCPLWSGADLVVLQPAAEGHELLVKRRSSTLAKLAIEGDRGDAAVARLALLAGLDPLVAIGSPEGRVNVARLQVRSEGASAELLIAVGASARGLEAEVRVLTGPPVSARSGATMQRCTRCGAIQAAGDARCALDGGVLEPAVDDASPGGAIGAWRILDCLGVGATGTVLAAEHALLGRAGAVKVLHASLAQAPVTVRRFLAEARAACRLRHPNVVEVTDFGLLATGQPYLVMERLRGGDLATRLGANGALPPVVALRMAREIARALEAAHAAGIVHNDLKPENVVLLEDCSDEAPRLKVVDFGASSRAGGVDEEERGILYGTPEYMAPERIQGATADGRADLYALGVMLYEMLTGSLPFSRDTPAASMQAQLEMVLPPPVSPFGAVPPSLTRLVERAVRKEPDERHQSATEMAGDIERALADLGRDDWRRFLP